MRGKRLILTLAILVVILAGWGISVKSASGVEVKQKQQELTSQADEFVKKELYIRAIPLYEEALTYSTQENAAIEEKLLSAYMNFGQADSYEKLVRRRAARGDAKEDEYIKVAEMASDSRLEDTLRFIKKGIENLNSDKLREYYESKRYAYTLRTTKFTEITPTKSNGLMPAYNGQKWGYVDDTGREAIPAEYDKALPFNDDGYAVVSINGRYYTITGSGARYGVDENPASDVYAVPGSHILANVNGTYSYYNYDFECVAKSHQYEQITSNACGVAAVKKNGKWGIITDSGDTVVDFNLEDVAVNSLGEAFCNNAAMVKQDNKWYLINVKGEKICDKGFDNAKAPESSGYIAVADSGGRWGFINQKGEEVIKCTYEDAYSFSNHVAAVKNGDRWIYISESNKEVISETMTKALPFHNGTAQIEFAGYAALLKLKYLEE